MLTIGELTHFISSYFHMLESKDLLALCGDNGSQTDRSIEWRVRHVTAFIQLEDH